MRLHESVYSPARQIDDLQLLQGLLTQRLYVYDQGKGYCNSSSIARSDV